MIMEDDETTDTGVSDPKAELRDYLQDILGEWTESVSGETFTTMRIEAPDEFDNFCSISAYVNPSYEGCFPLNTGKYDTMLKDYWKKLSSNGDWECKFIITSDAGKSILKLTSAR